MQTWLDKYIGQAVGLFQNIEKEAPQTFKGNSPMAIERRRALTDAGIAFRFFGYRALHDLLDRKKTGLPLVGPDMSEDLELQLFNGSLLPFVDKIENYDPIAFQLTPGLVNDLAGATITPEVFNLALHAIFDHRLFYLDIPARAYTVKGLWLRAIVAESSFSYEEADSTMNFCTKLFGIFEEPNTGRFLRFSWVITRPEIVSTAEGGLRERLGFTKNFQIANEEQMEMFDDIGTFAFLAIAYGALERENGERAAEYLPRLEPGHVRRQGRNARQTAKKFSLFSVAKLDNGGLHGIKRVANDNGGTAESRRLHKVRGHFRLQPYGEGRSKRRLQWIAAFERGDRSLVPVTKIHAIG